MFAMSLVCWIAIRKLSHGYPPPPPPPPPKKARREKKKKKELLEIRVNPMTLFLLLR